MSMIKERKLLLLGLLRQADMHGYMLNAHLDSRILISIKKPTAYNILETMEKDGWIKHRDDPTGDRPRRVYSLTAAGKKVFEKLLRQQLETAIPSEFPAMVSLGFIDAIPAAEAIDLIKKRKAILKEHFSALNRNLKKNAESDNHHSGFSYLPIEHYRRVLKLDIRFLEDVINHLEAS